LLDPLCLAGVLTWAAAGAGMLRAASGSPRLLLVALLCAFIAAFLYCVLDDGRRPPARRLAVIAQAVIGLAACLFAHEGYAPVLLVIAMAQLATLMPRNAFVAVILLANVGLYLIFRAVWNAESPLMLTLIYTGFQMFATTTALLAQRAERTRDELAQVNAHLLATHSLLEESARDGERLRLARELHDVAGHKLTALKLQLALLARTPGEASAPVISAAALADELLGDIRGVVGQMRTSDGLDLRRAIEELAVPIPHPKVHLELAEDARVDALAQAQALLRVAQEGLTNAARHSAAENVWLRLRRENDRLLLEIRDDGRGVHRLEPGHGLRGMRERIEGLGGTLDIDAVGGFHLSASVPLS
jgi:signal transduction histidine kinase